MTEPVVSVIFCEDIRREVGGKVSLMGCYGDVLKYPTLPAKQRLFLYVRILGRFERETNFRLTVLRDQDELMAVDINVTDVNYMDHLPGTIVGWIQLDTTIENPCRLSARVTIDDQDFDFPETLRIIQGDAQTIDQLPDA